MKIITTTRKITRLFKIVCVVIIASPFFACINSSTKTDQKSSTVNKKSHIVFLISEDPDNYEAHKTIPIFAEMLREKMDYEVTVLLGSGSRGAYTFPNFDVVPKADLLVVFARRVALPHEQMNALKNYLKEGKPLVGIRTANHAFTARDTIQPGFEDWPAFVADILGCENRGYGPVEPGISVSVNTDAENNVIVKDFPKQWHSNGNVYLVKPLLDTTANVLLTGKSDAITEPIAWTRTAGKSRVFYTSLGYPEDFKSEAFTNMLVNGMKWAMQ